jgi:ATP-binding cassette, subfamily C, bacterial LapB
MSYQFILPSAEGEGVVVRPETATHHANLVALFELLAAMNQGDNIGKIADALPYAPEDLELVDILNTMARLGFRGSPLKLRARDIDPRLLPCLFVTRRGKIGAITTPSKDRTSGTAYFFIEMGLGQNQKLKDASAAVGIGWLPQQMDRFRSLFWWIGAAALAQAVVAVSIPLFMMTIYDRVVNITALTTIYALGGGALIALAILAVLRNMLSRSLAWFSARLGQIISVNVVSQVLKLPPSATERAPAASQIARLNGFEGFADFFSSPLFMPLLEVPLSIISLLALFAIGGVLGFVPLAAIAICCLLALSFKSRLRLAMFQASQARSSLRTRHIELFEKLPTLRVIGMSEIWNEQFKDISAEGALAGFRAGFLGQTLDTLANTVITLGGLATIYVGISRVWEGSLSAGALLASYLLTMRLMAPWRTLCASLPQLDQVRATAEQINRLMALETEQKSALALGKPGHVKGMLAFSKVSLRYGKDTDPVFWGLSFTARPGEMIAIAGNNGCGKSTILKLALGLYRPQGGSITLDGRDIRQIDPSSLRRDVAYVPQLVEIFDGTVAENVRLGNPLASDGEILRALELDVEPEQEIPPEASAEPGKPLEAGMPPASRLSALQPTRFELDTQLKAGGKGLPSGLAHKIGLARAYVRNAQVMLIDELPLSFLNSPSGKRFFERLREWRGHKTILLVTHRNDLIQMSDQAIGLLSGGQAVIGAPDEIIRKLRDASLENYRRVA